MGRAKQMMEEGYSSCGNLTVCCSCFGDQAIKDYIEDFSDSSICTYCKKDNVTACSLTLVVAHIVESINYEWDDPANAGVSYESAEGGYQLNTTDTYDLLSSELELDIKHDDLIDDINSNILNTNWCPISPYSLTFNQRLLYGWKSFSEFVKYNSRYVLFKPNDDLQVRYQKEEMEPEEILEAIGVFINDFRLLKKIETSEELFRVRIENLDISYDSEKQLGSPPKEYCTLANRMSPAGISMFYGAFDVDTSIKEVYVPESGITKKAICGVFKATESLTVIDLSNIPTVPSLFDEENRHYRGALGFLNDFIIDFCKPIERVDRTHVDYVPTQIVTEFFRHILLVDGSKNVNGVVYPSAKNNNENCIVIFANSEQCCESGKYGNKQILKLNNVFEIKLINK